MATPKALLTVGDLKQASFCRRIPFFNAVLHLSPPPTFMMEKGATAEQKLDHEKLSTKLAQLGVIPKNIFFDYFIESSRLGLAGTMDILVQTDKCAVPIEVKYTETSLHENHIAQLTGYSLLLDDKFGIKTGHGMFLILPLFDFVKIAITDEMKRSILETMKGLRKTLQSEVLPEPTPFVGRCNCCEYINFCNDIF